MSEALEVKEQLYTMQQKLLYDGVVIQVGLNMPGGYALYPWQELFYDAVRAVETLLETMNIPIYYLEEVITAIGPFALFCVQADEVLLKRKLVEIENHYPHGRLWDFDVITVHGVIDRKALGLDLRQCLVCKEQAYICRKLGKHNPAEVIAAAKRIAELREQ